MYNTEDEKDTASESLYNKIQEMEQHLFSLLCLPLTMMLLVFLLLEDAESLSLTKTVTQIYNQMVEMKIKQVAERLHRKPSETRHINLIERTCNQWLKDLKKVAWETLTHNTHILDEKCTSVLLDKALDYNIDPMDVMSSFLKCKMFGTKYIWEFFHKAFQEYLSASYLNSTTTEEARESYAIMYDEHFSKQALSKKPTDHTETPLMDPYITLSEYERFAPKSSKIKTRKANCFSLIISCFQNICRCKTSLDKRSNNISYQGGIVYYDIACNTLRTEENAYSYLGSVSEYRTRALSVNRNTDRWKGERSRSISKSESSMGSSSKSKSSSSISRIRSRSESERSLVESPYEIGISLDDNAQKKLALQNTLQFLGAMEASKPEVDYDKMKDIVERFYKSTSLPRWSAWATLIRECQEHPIVCQLVQPYLNDNEIRGWDAHLGMTDYLKTIEYLLKKTRFIPGKVSLWITENIPFPEILGSVLSTFGEVLPTTVTELVCFPKHCSKLHQSLAQMSRLDLLDLTIMGTLEKSQSNEFVGLMKYLDDKEVEFKLKLSIRIIDDLSTFADCCRLEKLPRKTELEVSVQDVSEEMLNSLCQILKAFSWVKTFTFAFTDADLSGKVDHIQQLLIKALEQVSVQLTKVELTVETYAESRIQLYEDMAQAVAGEVPVAVTFNDWADGDDIHLTLQGKGK